MSRAKIHLSEKELQLVQNSDWLLTKNIIIKKVYELFGELASGYSDFFALLKDELPGELHESSPKISRGENYQGLPYVMLDYPRCFGKEDVFAIRTFFWWGNFFSITLHLKGSYQQFFIPRIESHWIELDRMGFRLCISEDEWEHSLSPANTALLPVQKQEALLRLPFFKMAAAFPLSSWSEMDSKLPRLFQLLCNSMKA